MRKVVVRGTFPWGRTLRKSNDEHEPSQNLYTRFAANEIFDLKETVQKYAILLRFHRKFAWSRHVNNRSNFKLNSRTLQMPSLKLEWLNPAICGNSMKILKSYQGVWKLRDANSWKHYKKVWKQLFEFPYFYHKSANRWILPNLTLS